MHSVKWPKRRGFTAAQAAETTKGNQNTVFQPCPASSILHLPLCHTARMNDDFIDPTPEGRRRLLWLTAVMGLLGALATYWLLPWFRTQMQVLPPCEALRLARGVITAMLLGLPLIVVLWALPLARGLWRTGQFPLPGAWVLRRTRIRRGRAVRVRAVALLVWSALTVVLAVGGLVLVSQVFSDQLACATNPLFY